MTESFTYKGEWFITEEPEKLYSGTLSFSPQKGIELELLGRILDINSFNKFHKTIFILGHTTNGKLITLYNCKETNHSMSFPGIETSKYYAEVMFIGFHFHEEKELKFTSISGQVKNLDSWVNQSGFKHLKNNFNKKSIELEYKLPSPIEFEISPHMKGKFNFLYSYPLTKQSKKLCIEQNVELNLSYSENESFTKMIQDFFHFQDFIILGTFANTFPLSIYFNSKCIQETIRGKQYPINIEVFFSHNRYDENKKSRISPEFLFNYKDISTNFPSIIRRWYQLQDNLRPINYLLFKSFKKTGKFNENDFLNIIQATETFHRRFRNNETLPIKKHKQRLKHILDAVTIEYKQWVKEKLQFSNEPTLHERLNVLIDEVSNKTIRKLIKNKEQFIREIKYSRNFYTHYDISLKKKAKKGSDLFVLSEKLKVILICSLLREIGFSLNQIESFLEKNEWTFFNHILDEY